jgi:hypothetical protein
MTLPRQWPRPFPHPTPQGRGLHFKGPKQNEAAPRQPRYSPNDDFPLVPQRDKDTSLSSLRARPRSLPQPPSPETGVISTTDRGHSVSAKTGRQHESCRIVAIGSRRCAILRVGRTFAALPNTKIASRSKREILHLTICGVGRHLAPPDRAINRSLA